MSSVTDDANASAVGKCLDLADIDERTTFGLQEAGDHRDRRRAGEFASAGHFGGAGPQVANVSGQLRGNLWRLGDVDIQHLD